VRAWWEVAELAGAGAAAVLGVVTWKLWKRVDNDSEYIRAADKSTLLVLQELTKVLSENHNGAETRHEHLTHNLERAETAVLKAIEDSVRRINEHIDTRNE